MSSKQLSEGYLELIALVNNFKTSDHSFHVPFNIGNTRVGLIRPDMVQQLENYPDVFTFKRDHTKNVMQITFTENATTYDERSQLACRVLQDLRQKDVLLPLRGWRNECYNIQSSYSKSPLMQMERAAVGLFGLRRFGVHINGYVRQSDGEVAVWVGKRSPNKSVYPGKYDQMVAGGVTAGQSFLACARKESQEEASVPEEYLDRLRPAGMLSIIFEDYQGMQRESLCIYDLELPEDFVPRNLDGEVESFELVPIDRLKQLIVTRDFKYNCAAVNLDFLIRHGYILPDDEPYYGDLIEGLHTDLESIWQYI